MNAYTSHRNYRLFRKKISLYTYKQNLILKNKKRVDTLRRFYFSHRINLFPVKKNANSRNGRRPPNRI